MRLRRPSGVVVYAAAFVALTGAGAAIASASLGLLRSTRLLWVSVVLSALAMILAVLSVVLTGKRT